MRPLELEPEEEVRYCARLHPVVLAWPLAKTLPVLAAVIAAFIWWRSAPVWFGFVLAAVLVAVAAVMAAHVARWRAGMVLVTTLRVAERAGLARRVGREIPIHKVADVAYAQGIVGQFLGYGEVTVESTGSSRAMTLPAVRAPQRFQHEIHRAERHRGTPGERCELAADSALLLETLWRRGVLSRDELEQRRATLGPLPGRHHDDPGGGW